MLFHISHFDIKMTFVISFYGMVMSVSHDMIHM